MLFPKSSTVPPDGFHFFEPVAGEKKVRIEGISVDDLARNLLLFRLNNDKPPGNPLQEVTDYICVNWSHFCTDSNPPPVPQQQRQATGGLASNVAAWMSELIRLPQQAPGDAEVLRRAEICARCPLNVEFANGCGACMDTIQRLSFVSRAGKVTPYDSSLRACSVLAQHNASAVWTNNLPAISDEQKEKLASNCWRK